MVHICFTDVLSLRDNAVFRSAHTGIPRATHSMCQISKEICNPCFASLDSATQNASLATLATVDFATQNRWLFWASWIRTNECSSQSAVPYHLAIAQCLFLHIAEASSSYHNHNQNRFTIIQVKFYDIKKGWVEGLEPSASRATIWRASQLRHTHHNMKDQ